MPQVDIDFTSADLEKDIQGDKRASSNRSNQEVESSMTSMETDPSSRELHNIEIKGTNEPSPEGVLTKVLSRTISRISIDPGPPPDGGLAAWTQVLMGHLIIFNTWGYINSFGVFQTFYVGMLGHPPADISWVRTFRGILPPSRVSVTS